MIPIVEAIALTLFVVVLPIWGFATWPSFVREARSGAVGLRMRAYVEVLVIHWTLTAALLLCWAFSGRPWARLGLAAPGLWGWVGLGVVALLAGLAAIQIRRMRTQNEESDDAVRRQLGDTLFLLPHDRRELRWFGAVALTAGFCEEVVYRGALPTFLGAWLPAPWAVVAATLAFALGHAYQGPRAIPKVAIAGAAMAIVTWATGSLWTAIALHALADLHGGALGWSVASRPAAAR